MKIQSQTYPTPNFQARQIAKAKKLEDYFEYEKIKKAPKIDPDKEFNITFKPTFLERIRDLFTTSLHI